MTSGVPTKVISSSMALSAFAVAIIAGLAADNAADVILARALTSMAGGAMLGLGIGAVAERAAREAILAYEARNPMNAATPPSAPQVSSRAPSEALAA